MHDIFDRTKKEKETKKEEEETKKGQNVFT